MAQEEYTAADREVKRSIRKDKRDYIDNLASQVEEAAQRVNLKDLYQATKKFAGKFQQTDKPVKDKNGERDTVIQRLAGADVMHTWQRLETAAGSEIRRAAS
nr:hypothetical protein BaRGS_021828 [Batillaria attramentaria]